MGDPLDGPGVLFDDVVQILVLAHQDADTGVGLDAFNGGRVGTALVDGDLLWDVVQVDGTLQNRRAAAMSRLVVSKKSIVSPARSTAR